jgi:CheY-like chemotaxis protein
MPEPIHVLVVDDDDDVRETIELALEAEGFQVRGASNGREALAALDGQVPPPVMLLDLRMPIMSGWEVIDTLRTAGRLAEVPIIVCTSSPDESPHGLPVVAKPIELAGMVRAIRRAAAG